MVALMGSPKGSVIQYAIQMQSKVEGSVDVAYSRLVNGAPQLDVDVKPLKLEPPAKPQAPLLILD